MVQAARKDNRASQQGRTGRSQSNHQRKKGDSLAKFDSRYADWWQSISKLCRKMTRKICCWCLSREATETHHACYSDDKGAIAGREVPGIHVFGVCNHCHEHEIHTKRYWIKDRQNPVLGNRNTEEAIVRLRFGFRLLSGTTLLEQINHDDIHSEIQQKRD